MQSEPDNQPNDALKASSADASDDSAQAAAGDPSDPQPRRKRRRRRRRRAGDPETSPKQRADLADSVSGPKADASEQPPPQSSTGGGRKESAAWQSLATGLFSHLDERQIPCKVEGCDNTWTWTAQEQMQAFGQPPPKRMCGPHLAQLTAIEDREVPCANPGCTQVWIWSKKAQVSHAQRTGSTTPPRKVCSNCSEQERELRDREVPCRLDGCHRTWTWTRESQLKHRTWARRQAEENAVRAKQAPESKGSEGKRRRRRRRPHAIDVNQPPPRTCSLCREKQSRLVEREVPCKVHGCTNTATIDSESQLRAWAKLKTEDLELDVEPARRMCKTCRDFCRNHPDHEVPCGRHDCTQVWVYKTGAQLQDFLAGRRPDPNRLCPECGQSGLAALDLGVPEGVEVMPCAIPHCDGTWFFRDGVTLVARNAASIPLDRMCDPCRHTHGVAARGRDWDDASALDTSSADPSSADPSAQATPLSPAPDDLASSIESDSESATDDPTDAPS